MSMIDTPAIEKLLGELEALHDKATPGPWYTLDPPWLPSGTETSILAGTPDPHVATFICDFHTWAVDDDDDRKGQNPDEDATLLVAARNAIPTLITTIRALMEAVEDERERCAKIAEWASICCSNSPAWWQIARSEVADRIAAAIRSKGDA